MQLLYFLRRRRAARRQDEKRAARRDAALGKHGKAGGFSERGAVRERRSGEGAGRRK